MTKEMITEMKKKLVARRVRGGANETQSWRLLREHLNNHPADDGLAMVLHYDGFATEKQAYKFIAALRDRQQQLAPVPAHKLPQPRHMW